MIIEITVVDFSVTEVGLEEQILAVVVDKEHPELEKQRSDLIRVQNESTIRLKQLEDRLLERLSSSHSQVILVMLLPQHVILTIIKFAGRSAVLYPARRYRIN